MDFKKKSVSILLIGSDETCWLDDWFFYCLVDMIKIGTQEEIHNILRDFVSTGSDLLTKQAKRLLDLDQDKFELWLECLYEYKPELKQAQK